MTTRQNSNSSEYVSIRITPLLEGQEVPSGMATMAKLRARIDNDPKPLERLARRLNKSKFVLSGEEFKRPKGDAGKLLNPWYNRKNIAIGYDDNPEGVLFTPQLKGEVLDGFRFLMPYYRYLDTLAGDMEPNR